MEEKIFQVLLTMQQMLNNMNKEFIVFRQEVNQKFEEIDKRFEAIDQRFEAIDKRFERIEQKIDELKEGQIQLKKQRDIDVQNLAKILEEQIAIRMLLEAHINEPFEIAHRKQGKVSVM